jgi:S-adenosylmethionine:tRNA-ribosyltransferase-isomerase (queuine synthetase)
MNSKVEQPSIKCHADLIAERKRLEMNIAINKILLRREYDSVKTEIVEKVKPISATLHFTRRVFNSLKTPSVVIGVTSLLINLFTRNRKQLR